MRFNFIHLLGPFQESFFQLTAQPFGRAEIGLTAAGYGVDIAVIFGVKIDGLQMHGIKPDNLVAFFDIGIQALVTAKKAAPVVSYL